MSDTFDVLDTLMEDVRAAVVEKHKRVHEIVHEMVVKVTPVKTGRHRSSWRGSVGAPDDYSAPAGGKSYGLPPEPKLGKLQPFDISWESNAAPAIERLEDGYSKQAPAGMTASALAAVELKEG